MEKISSFISSQTSHVLHKNIFKIIMQEFMLKISEANPLKTSLVIVTHKTAFFLLLELSLAHSDQ